MRSHTQSHGAPRATAQERSPPHPHVGHVNRPNRTLNVRGRPEEGDTAGVRTCRDLANAEHGDRIVHYITQAPRWPTATRATCVQDLLGPKDPKTTARYARVVDRAQSNPALKVPVEL